MLRAWKNHKRLQNHDSGRSWVLKIAANLCRDRIRRNRHPASRTHPIEGDVVTHTTTPFNDAIQREQLIQIRSAIADLPNDYRAVMHLHCVEKLSLAEIAAITGDRVGTIKVRLSRARKKMRTALMRLGVLDLEEDPT